MPTSRAGKLRSDRRSCSPALRLIGGNRAARGEGRSGFTLIELSLVLFLIGLFAALTLPLLTGIGRNDLRASARRLTGTVKYLYNEAALSGLEHRLVLDLDRKSYFARRLEASGELVAADRFGREKSLPGGIDISSVTVAERGSFTSGQVTVAIYPAGWVEETIIHLERDEQHKMTLRIKPLTGTTEIYEGYREF